MPRCVENFSPFHLFPLAARLSCIIIHFYTFIRVCRIIQDTFSIFIFYRCHTIYMCAYIHTNFRVVANIDECIFRILTNTSRLVDSDETCSSVVIVTVKNTELSQSALACRKNFTENFDCHLFYVPLFISSLLFYMFTMRDLGARYKFSNKCSFYGKVKNRMSTSIPIITY